MNSKILKLDAPYNIIYAGGRVGRHIATMTVWEDNDMGIYDAHQYAMIDEGGELAAGALAVEAELGDCRVICNESDPRVRLRWLAEIIEYDRIRSAPGRTRRVPLYLGTPEPVGCQSHLGQGQRRKGRVAQGRRWRAD